MKTYTSSDGFRRVWFDRHIRLWAMQTIDADGNQVGECDFTANRSLAFAFLDAAN